MAATTLPDPTTAAPDEHHNAHRAELHELLTELVHLARLGQADKEDPWTVLHALERLALEAFDAADAAYAEPAAAARAEHGDEPAPCNPGRAIEDILNAQSLVQLVFCAARVQDTVPSGDAIRDACNLIHGHLDAALEALGEKQR